MWNWYFASGDLDFFWKEQLQNLSWAPKIFETSRGFGHNGLLSLWLDYPFRLILKILSTLGLQWFFIEKILWASVFAIAAYSSYRLAAYVLKGNPFRYIASIIYAANTYILLLFGGGQLGVALAYAYTPWAFVSFIKLIDTDTSSDWIRRSIRTGLWFALLITLDLRIAYLCAFAVGLYAVFHFRGKFKLITTTIVRLVLSFVVSICVHLFWILPTVLTGTGASSKGAAYVDPGMLTFLSFADFSHSLGLLHPNWPENFFGKVYFMQAELLFLPILAFSALLWFSGKDNRGKNTGVLFFSILALAGAFLAKGVQDPVGGLYRWLFVYLPGFVMFRDPTKFYIWVALAYSILIPFGFNLLTEKRRKIAPAVIVLFIVFWCFTIRDIWLGRLRGNFKPIQLEYEYVLLKDMLTADSEPSRTLWLPQKENFGYHSDVHPALVSSDVFENASLSAVMRVIDSPQFTDILDKAGAGYVIVPIDVEERMFLDHYKFDKKQRDNLIDALVDSPLIRDERFNKLAVFRNHQFTMSYDTPEVAVKQQTLANTGVVISLISLIGFGAISLARKKN